MAGTTGLEPAASAVTVRQVKVTASDARSLKWRETLAIPRVCARTAWQQVTALDTRRLGCSAGVTSQITPQNAARAGGPHPLCWRSLARRRRPEAPENPRPRIAHACVHPNFPSKNLPAPHGFVERVPGRFGGSRSALSAILPSPLGQAP